MMNRFEKSPKLALPTDYCLDDVVVAHDVDRYLLDTEKAFKLAARSASLVTSLTENDVHQAYEDHKQRRRLGRTKDGFNVVGYFEDTLQQPGVWRDKILPQFIELGRTEDILLPGASELINTLNEQDVSQMLITYGAWNHNHPINSERDRERAVQWQLGKIATSPLLASMKVYVTSTPAKAKFLSIDQRVELGDQQSAIFLPNSPGDDKNILAKHVILGDDKAEAFNELDPSLMSGVLAMPESKANQMAFQKVDAGKKLTGVTNVSGLYQAKTAILELIEDYRRGR